jgi:hypothetical protein
MAYQAPSCLVTRSISSARALGPMYNAAGLARHDSRNEERDDRNTDQNEEGCTQAAEEEFYLLHDAILQDLTDSVNLSGLVLG